MSVKFGIQIEPQLGFDYASVEKIALEGEKVEYDSIWSSDHFFLDDKSEERNCLECWTLLAASSMCGRRFPTWAATPSSGASSACCILRGTSRSRHRTRLTNQQGRG